LQREYGKMHQDSDLILKEKGSSVSTFMEQTGSEFVYVTTIRGPSGPMYTMPKGEELYCSFGPDVSRLGEKI